MIINRQMGWSGRFKTGLLLHVCQLGRDNWEAGFIWNSRPKGRHRLSSMGVSEWSDISYGGSGLQE